MRRLLAILFVPLMLVASTSASASAAPTAAPLAPVAGDAPIAAYGGYVVWSEKGADGLWRLVVFHDGAKWTLSSVAPRAVPFDVDAGPGALNRPEATFSRCDDEAAHLRCRLRVASLPGGGEAGLPVPHRNGFDDTLPSLWGYRVAFQRRERGARVAQLYLYDFTTRHLRRLRHGFVPAVPRATGTATAIDLVRGVVAFGWASEPASLGIGPRTEVRAERTFSLLLVQARPTGYVSGACGGRDPRSPNATARGALFLDLRTPCDRTDAFPAAVGLRSGATLQGPEVTGLRRIARDAATGVVYGVTAGAGGSSLLVRLDGITPAVTGS
jgi:hypothetical protein